MLIYQVENKGTGRIIASYTDQQKAREHRDRLNKEATDFIVTHGMVVAQFVVVTREVISR